jgi:hypothetical protein
MLQLWQPRRAPQDSLSATYNKTYIYILQEKSDRLPYGALTSHRGCASMGPIYLDWGCAKFFCKL